MSVEALQRSLHDDDMLLERALAGNGDTQLGAGEAAVREALLRMQQNVRALRTEAAALPTEQREQRIALCTDFESRCKVHDRRFEVLKEEASKQKLLGSPGAEAGAQGLRQRKQLSSQEENEREQFRAMQQNRDALRHSYSMMSNVSDSLNSQSQSISSMKDKYGFFGEKLDAASKLLGDLKRRSEEDTRYIWWSFIFFLSVVAWIVLRRLKVFKMIYLAGSWTWWSGSSIASLMQRILSLLAAGYKGFCDLLGIPSLFEDS